MTSSLPFNATVTALLAVALTGASSSTGANAPSRNDGLLVFSCAGCPGAVTGARLFTMRPDGTRLRALRKTEAMYEPRWSPDGRSIAVTRGYREIWLITADGRSSRRLTRPIARAEDVSPAWSPSGDRLLFVRVLPAPPSGGDPHTVLRTIGRDGTRPRHLLSAGTNVVSPEWSPDGTRIAFNDIADRMWVAHADGGARRRLGPSALAGREPRWSPDGARVAFVDFEAGLVRVLDVRSGRVRTLLRVGSVWAHAWSPDGRRLALMRTRRVECEYYSPDECESLELWIASATGTRRMLVGSIGDGGEIYGLDWRAGR